MTSSAVRLVLLQHILENGERIRAFDPLGTEMVPRGS